MHMSTYTKADTCMHVCTNVVAYILYTFQILCATTSNKTKRTDKKYRKINTFQHKQSGQTMRKV